MKTNKQEIVDAAAKLFITKHFDSVSLSEIAQAVGLQKGSLFNHIKGKEELYREVVEKYILNQQDPLLKFGDVSNCSLSDFIQLYLNGVDITMKRMKSIFSDDISRDYFTFILDASKKYDDCAQNFLEINQKEIDLWISVIKRAKETGEIKENIDEEWAAQMFRFSFSGIAYIYSFDGCFTIKQVEYLFYNFYNSIKK